MWIELLLFFILAICALWDAVRKEIPLIVVWIGMLTAVLLRAAGVIETESWGMMGAALLPGFLFWVISYVTREKVGYGDGWILLLIGLFIGVAKCMAVLMAALFAESVFLIIMMALQKIHGDNQVPFVPFLLAGLGVIMCG
jgi:leader peptidase (prepilin peptidase)/N-methyltransferase